MRHRFALAAVTSFALISAGCGKKSVDGAGTALQATAGLEAGEVMWVAGSTDLPRLLADFSATRAKVMAALPGASIDDDSPLMQLSSPEGWAKAGLDPTGEYTFVMDKRVGISDDDDFVQMPIFLTKVSDRDKLIALLTELDDKVKIGPEAGAITPLLSGDRTVGLLGAHGDRLAVAHRLGGDVDTAPAGFEAFLAGSGAQLADADAFKHAMHDGSAGAGLYFWIGDFGLDSLGSAFGLGLRDSGLGLHQNARVSDLLSMPLGSVGVRVGQDGLSVRLVPKGSTWDVFKAAFQGNDAPKDIGRVIPAKGWTAGRLSVDLKGDVTAALSSLGMGDQVIQGALGQLGLSWDEVTGALSGELGFGIDHTRLMELFEGGFSPPDRILIIGARDGDKADALVDKLTKVAANSMDLVRSEISVGGKKAIRLGRDAATIVVARLDDLLLLTQSEAAMAEAIARADGDNLSQTSGGAVLRERVPFAGVIDVGPALASLDRSSDYMAVLLSVAASSEAFRKDPTVALRIGFDDHALFATIKDAGLTYGLTLTGLVSLFVKEGKPSKRFGTPKAPKVKAGLPPICDKVLALFERCVDEMPQHVRDEARQEAAELRDRWQRGSRDGLENTCQWALSTAKRAAGPRCPSVIWE